MKVKIENVAQQIGQKIRQQRKRLNIKQYELAGFLRLTPQQLSKYELGISNIPACRLLEICRYLSVPSSVFYEDLDQGLSLATTRPLHLNFNTLNGQEVEIEVLKVQGTVSKVKVL